MAMKIPIVFFLLISLIGLISCNKDKEVKEQVNMDVQQYIQLLKSNQYDSDELPAFTSKDIDALLQYRNDASIVTKFPENSISSYKTLGPNYRLGVLVLWTIESIRKPPIYGMAIPGRFPSQNPFIALKADPSQWIENHDNEAYHIISQAYFDWWESNKDKDFNKARMIDPLENTSYTWH